MKKRILLYTMLAIFFATNADAKVWRVNNNSGVSADFNNLQTAINSASVLAFDTLYVEGSYTSYGDIDVNKPIMLFGTGYFLAENDMTQAFDKSSILSSISFNSGSSGSLLSGFFINGGMPSGACSIRISCNNITISRNRILPAGSWGDNGIFISSNNLVGIVIHSNYITTRGNTGLNSAIYSTYQGINVIIKNNYLSKSSSVFYPHYSIRFTSNNPGEILILNNIFGYDVQTYSAFLLNNIMYHGVVSGTGNSYANNIGNSTQFGNQNGNQQNVDMSTVFVNHTSGVDNGLLLKPGSPAIGAGFGGVDCGIFGGENPYVLSGLPPIPSIFEVNQAGIGSPNTPIQVNLKAKSNR